jgi:hypothetical protein
VVEARQEADGAQHQQRHGCAGARTCTHAVRCARVGQRRRHTTC